MTTQTAPIFTLTYPGFAGGVTRPLRNVPRNTSGIATATITSDRMRGTGDNRRLFLGLRADSGATAVAVIEADRLRHIPAERRTEGARVEVRGTVRHLPGGEVYIEVTGIAPADRD